MRRFFALLGLSLALAAPAQALSPRARAALAPNPCNGIAAGTDFVANGGIGVFCLNGERYSSFLAMPGASYSGSVSGTGATVRTAATSSGALVSFANGVPRVTDLGLLAEEARTNLAPRSQEFDNTSVWLNDIGGTGVNPVRVANAALAPDGTMTADQITFNSGVGTTTSDQSSLSQAIAVSNATPYAASIYLNGPAGAKINVRQAGSAGYTLITLGGGWQRVVDIETSVSTSAIFEIGIRQGVNGAINSTVTIQLWGAQLEAGTFATSYIPTTNAAVLRAPDMPSISINPQSRGTVLVGANALVSDNTFRRAVSLNDNTTANEIWVGIENGGGFGFVNAGGVAQVNFTMAAWSGPKKSALAFAPNDFAQTLSGGAVQTDTSGTVPSVNAMNLGNVIGVTWFNGFIRQAVLYQTRFQNAQLQALTQ